LKSRRPSAAIFTILEAKRMNSDVIKEIWIDNTGSLCIRPKSERFEFIYRSAKGVYWNSAEEFIYPQIIGSWSPADWFRQVLEAVKDEYGCRLYLTSETSWANIDEITRKAFESECEKR
jgi:hypothetical protein